MSKLQLQYPLKYISINQSFGQNATDVYAKQGMAGHNGVDFYATHGTPVYASHDGLAQYQVDSAGGHGVVIITNDAFDYKEGCQAYFKTIYWHLCNPLTEPQYASPIADKTGFTPVKVGQVIGYANNTGMSTGTHLHFGLKPVKRGSQFGTYENIENNAYYGAINPKPYFTDAVVNEFKTWIKMGDENNEVVKLQAFFLRTGRMQPITKGFGYYGPATALAVKNFQIDSGIKHNNGVQVGPLTLKALNKAYE